MKALNLLRTTDVAEQGAVEAPVANMENMDCLA